MTVRAFFKRRAAGALAVALVAALAIAAFSYRNVIVWSLSQLRLPNGDVTAVQGLIVQDLQDNDFMTVAQGLEVPWGLAFLPDRSLLVTERPGRLKRISSDGAIHEVTGLSEVAAKGEGGLLGVAVHPGFEGNGWIYLYATVDTAGGLRNRVDRYRLKDDKLTDRTTIVQDIPAGAFHDGGAVAFGPDGKLYVATGDGGESARAQDLNSLGGKILRLRDDGQVPADNPYASPVWTYGHRNVQGLAWDDQGRMWATEHGRSGIKTGFDELNLIEKGANYGWPQIEGLQEEPGMRRGVAVSGPAETWAPSGAVGFGGSILFGGLRGEALYQAKVDAGTPLVLTNFENQYGRIRAVALGPDRQIYFSTSNRDGRGLPKEGDDRIIRVNPRLFH